MIIDGKVLTEPRAWMVSKVNRIAPNGISRITLAQDIFDQHRDYVELNDEGNVIGMWADYFGVAKTPNDPTPVATEITSTITCKGKAVLKVGGSAKTFSVHFRKSDEDIDYITGEWQFTIDDEDASELLDVTTDGLEPNQIKIKAPTEQTYIGKLLTIKHVTDAVTATLDVEIVAL